MLAHCTAPCGVWDIGEAALPLADGYHPHPLLFCVGVSQTGYRWWRQRHIPNEEEGGPLSDRKELRRLHKVFSELRKARRSITEPRTREFEVISCKQRYEEAMESIDTNTT
ncbi:hypothetical protein IOCL2690_000525800 [Leishmania lindenbergi]|uniref:Uncharacterized protein n=1 Tax=Leishmania lindenbergi TaxID=651832 RepID=A0AAW3A9T4_9TRYP